MDLKKKDLAITILTVLVGASLISNIILPLSPRNTTDTPYHSNYTAVIGGVNSYIVLDPIDTGDYYSRMIQHQITQSLVEYDLSSYSRIGIHNYSLKPVLVEYWIWESPTRISYKLRENVYFHDNTLMTAEDVKWNFERGQWFCNTTGDLPLNETSREAFSSNLFFFSDGTPIFNKFIANDTRDPFNFTLILNTPFGALNDFLASGLVKILSPESTPFYKYLDITKDKLIGTGPYEYLHYERYKELILKRSSIYWGFAGYFEMIEFRFIDEPTSISHNYFTAACNGEFDYLFEIPPLTFCGPPPYLVIDVGEDLCYFYLEIYCGSRSPNGTMLGNPQYQRNPPYLRRTLALAIDYTYIYDEIQSGYGIEGTTAVPRAMPGHNASVIQASDISRTYAYNLAEARQILKDNAADIVARGGLNVSNYDINNDSDWIGKNILGRNLEINCHFGSTTNLRLNQLLSLNFDLIGIQISETTRDWKEYLSVGEQTPWEMDLNYMGRCPDYLNPYNIIDPLFNLDSNSCFSRINDTTKGGLIDMMDTAIKETNRTKQLEIYENIQSYIFDVNRPLTPASHAHISGWVYLIKQAHMPDLKGVNYNVMKIIECWKWYYE
ncbi:MAG: ABC transporter substrate-binding protein [Promethearchaeota archaeon]